MYNHSPHTHASATKTNKDDRLSVRACAATEHEISRAAVKIASFPFLSFPFQSLPRAASSVHSLMERRGKERKKGETPRVDGSLSRAPPTSTRWRHFVLEGRTEKKQGQLGPSIYPSFTGIRSLGCVRTLSIQVGRHGKRVSK